MKNPNSLPQRLKRALAARWSAEDYPGAEPRFQATLFAKDISIFVLLPILAVLLYSVLTQPRKTHSKKKEDRGSRTELHMEGGKSQIIVFGGAGGASAGTTARRSPGTIVRVRLQNVVETYTTAPVHAQIVGVGLGAGMRGGVLIGDATPDTTYERISITFRYAKDPARPNSALSISARALSLNGTLGLVASKKEGFFARSAIGSASAGVQGVQGKTDGADLGHVLLRALTAGLLQEFGGGTEVEKSRAQVLTLAPGTEFFAELTDFFPGASR